MTSSIACFGEHQRLCTGPSPSTGCLRQVFQGYLAAGTERDTFITSNDKDHHLSPTFEECFTTCSQIDSLPVTKALFGLCCFPNWITGFCGQAKVDCNLSLTHLALYFMVMLNELV